MRRSLLAVLAVLSSCQSGGKGSLCDAVTCKDGFACDPRFGFCKQVPAGSGGGSAGGGSAASVGGGSAQSGGGSAASGGGSSATTCDPACSGTFPFCDTTSGAIPECVQCLTGFDCPTGMSCELGSCQVSSGTGGSGGGSTTGPVIFDDGGMSAHCLQTSGPSTCTGECRQGYVCVGGQCELRGRDGPVQVTLRFNQPEDLDLHVVEPLPDGGTCEIWYGNPNVYFDGGFPIPIPIPIPIPMPASCGAKGWLDLDSNAACNIDNVDVENVIYPMGGVAPSGRYIVRVDYYEYCSASGPVPYEVEIRANGQSEYYCGTFDPNDANGGAEGSGRTIAGFTVP